MPNAQTRSRTAAPRKAGREPANTLKIYVGPGRDLLFSATIPAGSEVLLTKSPHVRLSVADNFPARAYSLRPIGRRRARRATAKA